MTIQNVQQLVDAEFAGKTDFYTFRKAPNQTTANGIWVDLGMSPGNPVPNYYAATPNVAIALAQSTDGGLYHGGAVSPEAKYLKTFGIQTATSTAVPMPIYILDYLMYYPFVDMSDTSATGVAMTTNIALPRYPTGVGVKIMPVVVAGPSGVGNPQFYVSYYNTNDELKYTPTHACNTQVVNGTVVHSMPVGIAGSSGVIGTPSPFLTLASGDTGVKSIANVFWLGSGDIGLVSFVLVKPVAETTLRQTTAWHERNYYTDISKMPVIADDAYLNMICCPPGTLSGALITGYMQTVFG